MYNGPRAQEVSMAVLTPDEVARKIRMSPATVRRYIRDGDLPAKKVGGEWRVDSQALATFIGTLPDQAGPKIQIIAVANQKGGVGKTTSAVALAAGLADLGQRTLFIDLDPQGGGTGWLGFDSTQRYLSLGDIMKDAAKSQTDPDLTPAIVRIEENLDLVPAHINMTGLDLEIGGTMEREWILHEVVTAVAGRYDKIILDLPPTLTLLAVSGLLAADTVIIPQIPDAVSVQGLGQLADTLKHLRRMKERRGETLTVLGVVLTQVRAGTNHHRQYRQFIGDFCTASGIPFLSAPTEEERTDPRFVEIPQAIGVPDARGLGIPLSRYRKAAEASAAYRHLAQLLIPVEALHV